MRFHCTIGTLREKLDSMRDLFENKIALDYIYYDGSPTYFYGANGSESRYQVYNYKVSVPSLGLEFREGFDCTWEETEQKLYQWESVTFVSDSSDGRIHVCDDWIEELVEWHVRTNNIKTGDINSIECVIETGFEAD